jgi:hypothetical protein
MVWVFERSDERLTISPLLGQAAPIIRERIAPH